MPKGQRLDLRLIEMGLFANRQTAQAAIMDGGIFVDGHKQTKSGTIVNNESIIKLDPNWGPPKYVSRGGFKLKKALKEFNITVDQRVCIDVGASTGGFTDCLLKHGASIVYAVDVGYGQLHWSLRNDPKVIVCERVNARELSTASLYKAGNLPADLAVVDVSFISLGKILPACLQILASDMAEIVTLIKPQFEAGRNLVGKGGVVRSPNVHQQVINTIFETATSLNLIAAGLTFSPVKGPAGNIEYLAYFVRNTNAQKVIDIEQIVANAHKELNST